MAVVYELDGNAFKDLASFASLFSATVLEDYDWNGNLDAFNDILRGGFGTPDEGFTIRILNAGAARRALGYAETIKWFEERVEHCHPANRNDMARRLGEAQAGRGPTLFDMLVEIIAIHGASGDESEDNVVLELIEGAP